MSLKICLFVSKSTWGMLVTLLLSCLCKVCDQESLQWKSMLYLLYEVGLRGTIDPEDCHMAWNNVKLALKFSGLEGA